MMNDITHARDTATRKLNSGSGRQGNAGKKKGGIFRHTGTAAHDMNSRRRGSGRTTDTQSIRNRTAGGIKQTIGDSGKNKGTVS